MTRDAVLDAVRSALAGVVVPPLPHVPASTVASDRELLAARFAREARAVGTVVHEVAAPTAAIEIVAGILGALPAPPRVVTWATPLACALATAAVAVVAGAALRVVDDGADAKGAVGSIDSAAADVGVTEADYLVADSGTLVLRAAGRARGVSLLPPVHVAIVTRDRLRVDLGTALADLRASGAHDSCVTLVTGPSRTADIEKKLVVGVHGPCALHVVLLDRAEA
jgi:L-lactate dehydrogenase complex protein LldG